VLFDPGVRTVPLLPEEASVVDPDATGMFGPVFGAVQAAGTYLATDSEVVALRLQSREVRSGSE
jgi:hypothetical protein